MTATNHTEHYELSQYTDNDHPTYTGDYNGDMAKIDTAIYAASQSGGLTAVTHTNDLTGDGSDGNPLGVADTIARSKDIPSLDRVCNHGECHAGDCGGDSRPVDRRGYQAGQWYQYQYVR